MAGTASYTPEAGDYIGVQRATFLRQIRSRKFFARVPVVIVGVTVAIMGVFVALGCPVAIAVGMALAGGIGGAVTLSLILGITYLLIPRRATRTFAQQRTLHHETRADWSAEGLTLQSSQGEGRHPWDELHGWSESSTLVLILASDLLNYFIPKRALDAAALDDLRATLDASGLPRR